MRHLGIDYGSRRVGVALSDENGVFAFPEAVFPNDRALVPRIWDVIKTNGVGEVILGASYDYAGKENPLMKEILRFKQKLEDELDMTVSLQGETLSSAEAHRMPKASDAPRSRKPRADTPVDASAAAIILQRFLDARAART